MKVTIAQITKIHVLLNQLGLMPYKRDMVMSFTDGRETSTKGLTSAEARDFIKHLVKTDPREKHRKAIKHLAYKAGIIYGDTWEDMKINKVKLDAFLRRNGAVKKGLDYLTMDEIKIVHRQFEGIVRNNAKTANNKEAKALTDDLLNELQLTVK